MKRRILLAGLATPGVLYKALAGALAQEDGKMDFSTAQLGLVPEGFTIARTGKGAPAEWKIVEDASVSGGRVLEQTSTDRTDYRFPLAIYQPVAAVDLEVTVRFKAVAGRVDRAGGIAVRLIDSDNYYVVRANALEDNVNFYRVVKGVRREVHGVRQRVSSGAWHVLGLRAESNRFTVSFDGKQLFTIQDDTFSSAGKVALWTKADSVTQFHQLAIRQFR